VPVAAPDAPARDDAVGPDATNSPLPRWLSPRLVLALMITGFTAVSVYAGAIAFYDFQTRNATDLTIFMQALTSTIRGHPAPFYESYDCMTKARCSFFLVHPSPFLYLAVPFYAVAPSPLTLFALQSVGVGLAAVPLYYLTRTVTGSEGKGLVAAALYLVWAPTLGGEAFSFHLEAFLPLALLTVAVLWATGRFRLGFAAAAVAFLVLEIAPAFTFLIGAFFLSFAVQRVLVRARADWREHRAGGARPAPLRSLVAAIRSELQRSDVRYTLVLMGASVAAFVLLFLFMNVWGARVLGVPAPPLSPGLSGIFYENSSPGTRPPLQVLESSQFLYTAAFWVILYALVAFVPLLAPRTLIVSLPWIAYTFLTDTTRFVQIGSQYSLVAAVPIFFGLAYGMGRVPIPTTEPTIVPAAAPAPGLPQRWRRRRSYRALWVGALVGVVMANVVILPIDPLLADLGVTLPDPFQTGYQDHALTTLPGFTWAETLAGNVPPQATVTAPGPVFSLFANYPHAFLLIGGTAENNWGELPLNLTGGPDDVLLYPSIVHGLAHNFSSNLSNPALYGMVGWVGTTTVGPLLLYARGHSGPAVLYGPGSPPSSYTWFPAGGGLVPGPVGAVGPNASAPYGTAISDRAGPSRSGLLWSAPASFVAPGSYTVHVLAGAFGVVPLPSSSHPLLTVKLLGLGTVPQNWTIPASALSSGGWTSLEFNVSFADPVPALQLQGVAHADDFGIAIAAVSIEPSE
jgi:uncharacterized membrane protein